MKPLCLKVWHAQENVLIMVIMEDLFEILKSEMFYLNKYKDFEILKNDIDKYIYFYNNIRF